MKTIKLNLLGTIVGALLCSLSASTSAPLQIISPASPTLTNGSVIKIRWVPPVGVSSVWIQLKPDIYHGADIIRDATNSGEYAWTVSSSYDLNYVRSFFIDILAITPTNYWNGQTSYFTIVEDPGALPIILTPTNNQVAYVGDNLVIKWTNAVPGKAASTVHIKVTGNVGGQYFDQTVPNTGTYTWTVWKSGASQTQFTLSIADGLSVTNKSTIQLTIPNIPRPLPVALSIRRVVSVEWVSIPGHTYRLESSTDLNNWFTEFEEVASETNSIALFYVESATQLFRVHDLTP